MALSRRKRASFCYRNCRGSTPGFGSIGVRRGANPLPGFADTDTATGSSLAYKIP